MAPIFCNHLATFTPQTKILDGRTNVWERIFEVLFKGVSTRFGHVPLKSASKMRSQMFVRTSKSSFGEDKVVTKDRSIQNNQHIPGKQPSATRPIFGTNLHFGHLLRNFNLNSWLTVLTNCLKWRFVRKMGRVADGCRKTNTSHVATIFCNHLAKFMLPKRSFWMAERTFRNAFRVLFKWVSTRFGLRSFESASKMRSQMFIRTSKIFVRGA